MAGSRKNFAYTDDTGSIYAVSLDESNTEAVNGGLGDISDTVPFNVALPRNILPRAIYYSNADNSRVIRTIALSPDTYKDILDGNSAQTLADPIDSAAPALRLARFVGERRRVFKGQDTGLTDGDAT